MRVSHCFLLSFLLLRHLLLSFIYAFSLVRVLPKATLCWRLAAVVLSSKYDDTGEMARKKRVFL